MSNVQIAQTIAQQMGGTKRLQMFLGAMNFVAHENGLTFKFKGNRKFTHLKVTLNSMDTYDMEFIKVHGASIKTVKEFDGVYNDMLVSIFEDTTKLYLSF